MQNTVTDLYQVIDSLFCELGSLRQELSKTGKVSPQVEPPPWGF